MRLLICPFFRDICPQYRSGTRSSDPSKGYFLEPFLVLPRTQFGFSSPLGTDLDEYDPLSIAPMSTASESQSMAQQNEQEDYYNLSVTHTKRKRGRPRKDVHPRKDEISGSEPNKRSKQCTVLQSPISKDGLVGQEVSCSFTGVFDAGYLLTVQVGSSGPILTGLVFDPRLSVPVSAENDIAPHLPMLGRNGFSSPVEDFINQGADSSQDCTAQKAGLIQHIQAKESPTTSSFTSHVQTDLQLNMMEVTPSQSSHVPQVIIETMEPQHNPKSSNVFLEGAATETSDQSPLASSYHYLQSQAKGEHTPISVGLPDISMEAPALNPSNGYNPSVLPMVTSSEVSKPSNVLIPEAVTNASSEPSNIPKEALSTTAEASLNVSNDMLFDIFKEKPFAVLKPSEASVIAQKITGGIAVENLSSEKSSYGAEESSEDRKVDESLGE